MLTTGLVALTISIGFTLWDTWLMSSKPGPRSSVATAMVVRGALIFAEAVGAMGLVHALGWI